MIYFVECAGFVKIGLSKKSIIQQRFRIIKCNAPFPCTMLGVMEGDASAERKLHQRFSDLQRHGEWFIRSDELDAFINQNAKPVDRAWASLSADKSELRAARLAAGLTLDDVASRMGVHKTSVLRWEAHGVPAKHIESLSNLIGSPKPKQEASS